MPANSAGLISRAFAVFGKDLRQELRSRYAVGAILMFGVVTLTLVSYSLGQSGLHPKLLAALFWIIMFFSSMAGLAQVFVREEEAGTALALRLSADPDAIYLGKFAFNLSLLTIISVIIVPGFFIFMDASTDHIAAFLLVAFLGVLCLCTAMTLIAAMIAKAAVKGALFGVVAMPLLIVPLMVLVVATAKTLDGGTVSQVLVEAQALTAYIVVMGTASFLLFKFVWLD